MDGWLEMIRLSKLKQMNFVFGDCDQNDSICWEKFQDQTYSILWGIY